jgi:hypothetical protein
MFWREKVLLAKPEVTAGTDSVPAGDANAILGFNVSITPMDGDDIEREIDKQVAGGNEVIPTGLRAVLKFDTELSGSGTAGVAPAWGVLMRGSSLAETIVEDTSVTYNPIALPSGETLSMYFQMNGTLHKLSYCRGTFELALDAQQRPIITWTFTGIFADPAEASVITPTLAAFKRPLPATKVNTPTFTVGGTALVMRSFKLTMANDVKPRFLVGRDVIMIEDRKPQVDFTVEAVPLTSFNPYTKAKDPATRVALSLVHGTAAGNIITIGAPTMQMKRPTGYQQNQSIAEWPLSAMALPDEGNDELSIALT